MAHTANLTSSKAAILGLALTVSTACVQIATSAPQVTSMAEASPSHSSESKEGLRQKGKMRQAIKDAKKALVDLNKTLSESLEIFAGDEHFERDYLQGSPLPHLIAELRSLEAALPNGGQLSALPVIGEEYRAFRRVLAETRSLAVRIQILIAQRLGVPETFESAVTPEGLKALADLATDRLHRMTS